MKSLSIRMKSPLTHNRAAFVLFKKLFLAALFIVGVPLVSASPAGASSLLELFVPAAAKASAMPVADDDLITLLSLSLGGRDVAIAAWSSMNLHERQALRDQAARITIMAQSAERDGLLSDPEITRALRWGLSSFLADAWEKKIASEIDFSEEAVRAFYETHRQWYTNENGTPVPFEKSEPRVREDMVRAAILQRMEKLNTR